MLGGASLLAACGARSGAVRVGSKNFTEIFIIAEIYAQALERAGVRVERRFNLGSTQIAMAAMERGDIDLYPEYTGTALIDVLHLAPMHDPRALYATVAREFQRRYALTWLQPSPMNDSQGLATTRAIARREGIERSPNSRRSPRACAWRRFKSSSAAPTDCPACSGYTADSSSATCARTTSR